jgi:beta-glucanase (GH16 family)
VTGEIDAAESIGRAPTSLYATAHGFTPDAHAYPPFHWQVATVHRMGNALSAGFHTYAVDVSTNRIAWSVDGHTYQVLNRTALRPGWQWSFNTPMHVILSLAVGGFFAYTPPATTAFPASMVVDYVSVVSTG